MLPGIAIIAPAAQGYIVTLPFTDVSTTTRSVPVPSNATTCTAHLLARGRDAAVGVSGGGGGEMRTGIAFAVAGGAIDVTVRTVNGGGAGTSIEYEGSNRGTANTGNPVNFSAVGNGGTGGSGGTGRNGGGGSNGDVSFNRAGGGGAAGTTGNGGSATLTSGSEGARGTGVTFTDSVTGVSYQNAAGGSGGWGAGGSLNSGKVTTGGGGFAVLVFT